MHPTPETPEPADSVRLSKTSVSEPPAELHRFWLAFGGIALVGVLLRFAVCAQYVSGDPLSAHPIVDALTYWNWAGRIAAGQLTDGQPFFSAPLYPYLLGLVRACGGGLTTVYILQILLDVVTAGLLAWIGRLRWDSTVGLLASAVFLLMFEPAAECLRILSSTVQLTLVALAWLAWLATQRTPSLKTDLLAGAALGLLALTYPPAIVLLPILGLWRLWTTGLSLAGLGRAAVTVFAGLAVIAPATIHNYYVCGELIPISAQGGVTFAQGNTPAAIGTYAGVPGVSMDRELQNRDAFRVYQEATGKVPSWRAVNRYFFQRGLDFWRSDPRAAARLFGLKAYWFLTGHHYGDVYVPTAEVAEGFITRLRLMPLHTGWLIPLALLALAAWARHPRTYLPEIVLFALPLAVVVTFWFSPRYRLPALPVIALATAWTLWQAARRRQRWTWRALVPLALALGIGLGIANQATGFDRVGPRRVPLYVGLGWATSEAGQLEDAVTWYRKARVIDPRYPTLAANLGDLLMQLGRPGEALPYLEEVVHATPEDADAQNLLAGALVRQGQFDAALEHVQAAVGLRPDSASLQYNLAVLLLQRDDLAGAMAHLRESARLDPTSPRAFVQLSQILYATGDARGAIAALQKARELVPGDLTIATDLAWYLATTPGLEPPDRATALHLVEAVVAAGGGKSPVVLDTLAAAQAANGMFPEAVATVERALSIAEKVGATDLQPALRQRLALYAAGRPYPAPLPTPDP